MKANNNFEDILRNTHHNTPFLMLPVRLETHFRTRDDRHELCVRIYPGEAHLNYCNEALTPQELLDGKTFWLQWFIASGSRQREYEAWERLCAAHPVYRAAWIVRQLKPLSIQNWKPGGKLFYRRPYIQMDSIEKACDEIIRLLAQINLDERHIVDVESHEYQNEAKIRQNICKIKEALFRIDRDVMFNEFIVDYLFDKIKDTVDYLNRRLDAFIGFYKRFAYIYEGNLRVMELWDIDATILYTFKDEVDSFLNRLGGKRKPLSELVELYMSNPLHDIFPIVEINHSANPAFPVASLLPERFLFIGESADGQLVVKEGNRIEGNVAVSPLPEQMNNREPFSLNSHEDLEVRGDFAWAVDYGEAVRRGMAITVPIPDDLKKFNFIYVLGMRAENREELVQVVNSHIYSKGGLQFLTPGTATNNVQGVSGQFACMDPKEEMEIRYRIEVEGDFAQPDLEKSDAAVLARYLGLDGKETLYHSVNYDSRHREHTRNVYQILFDYFNRNKLPYLDEQMNSLLRDLENFVLDNMDAGGMLPTLKIGDHPYGILPVVDYKRMREQVAKYASKFELKLYDLLISLADEWHRLRKSSVVAASSLKGSSADAKYLFMAGQTPYSVRIDVRDLVYNPFLPQHCIDPVHPFMTPFVNHGFFTPVPVKEAVQHLEVENYDVLFQFVKDRYAECDDDELKVIVSGFLDLFIHRLDAWFLGFLHAAHWRYTAEKQTGLAVGAYGWVFNLEENKRHRLDNSDEIGEMMDMTERGHDIYDSGDRVKGEYIMAPSVQHAITAAILRSSYLKTKKTSSDSHMCVNLSSARIRQALRMIDGLKSGVPTGVVLGVDMERYIHENESFYLDQYIYPLRKLFPQRINLKAEDKRAVDHVMEVINGEALLNTFLDEWDNKMPVSRWLMEHARELEWFRILDQATSLSEKPERMQALFNTIERMADSYDALNDLLLAEGVHRMTIGDRESFYAISNFMAKGKGNLPEPAVLDSPAEYVAVTTKTGVMLPSSKVVSDHAFAVAEPSVNAWVGSLTDKLEKHWVRIRYADREGQQEEFRCSLEKLGMEPLEYLYMCDQEVLLKRYIEVCWRNQTRRADGKVMSIEMDWNDDIEDIKQLVLQARPMTADDFVNKHLTDTDIETFIDEVQLDKRYYDLKTILESLRLSMDHQFRSISPDDQLTNATVLEIYGLLGKCAASGMYGVLPEFDPELGIEGLNPVADQLAIVERQRKQQLLVSCLGQVVQQLKERIAAAEAIINEGEGERVKSQKVIEAIRTLTLKNFKVCPEFILQRAVPTEERHRLGHLFNSGLSYYNNVNEDEFDEWQSEVAEINEGMNALNKVAMFQLTRSHMPDGIAILQTDAEGLTDNKEWLGLKVSDESKLEDSDSMVIYNSHILHRNPFSGKTFRLENEAETRLSGLVVGSWLEYIPYRKKTAGIAMHVDMPDNEAPQCILLAMHPEHGIAESDKCWSMEDVMQLLDTTRFMIMNRAVEPDLVYQDPLLSKIFPLLSDVDLSKIDCKFRCRSSFDRSSYSSYCRSSYGGARRDGDIFDLMPGGQLLK